MGKVYVSMVGYVVWAKCVSMVGCIAWVRYVSMVGYVVRVKCVHGWVCCCLGGVCIHGGQKHYLDTSQAVLTGSANET